MVLTIRWFVLAIILIALASSAQAQGESRELRVVTRMMSPLVLNLQGQLSGFSIDLWNFIAQKLQARTRYHVAQDVGALLEEVQSGKADIGVAAISITPDREKQFDFSQPILKSGLQIMLRSRDTSGIKSPEDLPGKRVATTRGSTAATFLREIKANVHVFANMRSVYDALLDNKVDAVVFDAPVLLHYAANAGRGRVAMTGPLLRTEHYGIVFPQGNPLLKLLALRQDGTYKQLYDKWFTHKQEEPQDSD